MAEALVLQRMTYAEYLAFEDASETKHEWIDGAVYAMSEGSPEHSRLQARAIVALTSALVGKPCAPFTSDLRVHVAAAKRSTYPDVTVICDEIQHAPTVLVEVLSPSSEAEDRGEKWALYQRIASLQHYVLVSEHRPRVEVYTRTDLGWHYAESLPGEVFRLAALGATIAVDELHAGALAIG